MKGIYFFLLAILLFEIGKAQPPLSNRPEQDACRAVPICGNFMCPYSYRGLGNIQEQTFFVNGCFTEDNSVWLRLKVTIPGSIDFTITPVNPLTDYNFSVFDITSTACYNIPAIAPIRCNNDYLLGGLTGLSSPPSSTSYGNSIIANAGDEYLILLNIWSVGIAPYFSGFSIDFAGSTATFTGDTLPHFKEITNTCNKSQEVTVKLNEPVICSSIDGNGSNFYLTPGESISGAYGHNCIQSVLPDGYSDELTVYFDPPLSPGNYYLHAQNGTDGNSTLNLCGSQQPLTDSIPFTVDPYIPLTFSSLDSPACQFLLVHLSQKILCDSVAADGSDFKVTGPSTVNVVAASVTDCDANGLSQSILIAFQRPVSVDGIYHLIAQKGSDNNTLIDSCTSHQLEGDNISFVINSFARGQILDARPDTVLCKADTIQLYSNNLTWTNSTVCGIDTSESPCFRQTREATGLSGTSFYPNLVPCSVFCVSDENLDKSKHSQMLYTASELQALGFRAGKITSIGWTVALPNPFPPGWPNPPGGPLPPPSWWPAPFKTQQSFTIKLGCTSLPSIGGSPNMIAGLETVFSVNNYTPVPGSNDFLLDKPYNWDGFSNLVIEVCATAGDLSFSIGSNTVNYPPPLPKTSTTSFYSSITLCSANQQDACLMTFSNQGYFPTQRPDTRFAICSPPLEEPGPYHWSPTQFIIGDTASHSAIVYPPSSALFTVSTSDRFGCYLQDTVRITISELSPSVHPLDTTICLGETIRLSADASVTPVFYEWLTPMPFSLTCLDCQNPVAAPIDTSVYWIRMTDQYGCSDTLAVRINVLPLPELVVTPKDTTIKYGSNIQLLASGADMYNWYPISSLSDPNLPNPIATPLESTNYIVVGLLSNKCRSSDTLHIGIDYRDKLFIPSAFSPNGDGINDLFRVANLTFQKIQEFKVFNRWGQLVYSATDNKGWDGRLNGVAQDLGVYNYLIRIGYPDGYSDYFKGDVTIIR